MQQPTKSTRKYTPPTSTGWIKAGEPSTRPSERIVRDAAAPRHQSSPPQLESKSSKWMLDMDTFSKAMSSTRSKLLSKSSDAPAKGRGKGKAKPPSKIFWNPDEYYKNKEKKVREIEKERERAKRYETIPSPSQQQQSHEFDAPSSPSSLAKELTSDKALSQLARMRQAAGLSPVDEEKRAKDRLTTLRERRVDLEMRKAMIANEVSSNRSSESGNAGDSFQSHLATLANFSKRLNEVTIPSLKNNKNIEVNRSKRRKYTQDDNNYTFPVRSPTLEDMEADQREDELLFTQNGTDAGYKSFTQIMSERTPQKNRAGGSILVVNTPSPPSRTLRQTKLKPPTPLKHTYTEPVSGIPVGAIGFPELERAWEGTRPIAEDKVVRSRKRDKEKDTKRQSLISGWITQSQADELAEEVPDVPQKRLWGGMDMDSTDRPNVSLDVDSDYNQDDGDDVDDRDEVESLDLETPNRNKIARSLPLDFLYDDSPSSERAVANLVNTTQSQPQSQHSSGSCLPTPQSNIPGLQNLMQSR